MKNGKKIVVCAAQVPFVFGGAELMVDNLIAALDERGFEVEKAALPFKWYPYDTLRDNMLAWRLLDLDESNGTKIDLVIGTKFPSYGVRHDNKVVWLMHQYRQAYDLLHTQYSDLGASEPGLALRAEIMEYDRVALCESRARYAISQNVANRLKKFNDIDAQTLYQPPNNAHRFFGGDYGDYILSVGRLDALKRLPLLISALPHCSKNIRAVIAGRGPEMEPLVRLAKDLGVSDRVEFLGFVRDEDLFPLYANAFSVYFAPQDEDYGFITLEAFLSQRPVVTCDDAGGVLEFVSDGVNGFVARPEPESIGAAIERLWQDKGLCRRFGEGGRERVKDISWDNVVSALTQTL